MIRKRKNPLVFATHNRHKLEEIKAILPNDFELLTLEEVAYTDEIPETGNTLVENALIKARSVNTHTGYDCFADDTGLEVEALKGKPGVYSARYAGEEADSTKNIEKLMLELKEHSNRNAQFRTVIALLFGSKEYLFEGIVKGTISENASGKSGFGYDPVFIPEGYEISFSEMSSKDKNRISHRSIAIHKMIKFLNMRQLRQLRFWI